MRSVFGLAPGVRGPLVALRLVVLGFPAVAGSVNHTDGIAIKGVDPVAYFIEGRPVQGSTDCTFEHEGAVFRFASAANRAAFAADPGRYAPQCEDFCAFGTSNGYKAHVRPEAFTIADGKLYLNYNTEVRTEWSKDLPGHIAEADASWPTDGQGPHGSPSLSVAGVCR